MCVEYDSVKVKVVYTKKSMYPPEVGEYCLEELRDIITNIPVIQQLVCHIH